jgi:UDP-N-acetylglucosamine--N-acetylmuramyl-(pentapeptide) pyrophosphoryl-undecaprenol N-acetylglucosamine transferase
MKILFTGGGTAGHINPIIAISRKIKEIYPQEDIRFFYIGPKDNFAENLLSQEGFKIKTISSGKIRRYLGFQSFFQNISDILFKIPVGFFQALFYIFIFSPDLIFSKGGYGSIPVVLAGWLLMVPIFFHESDVSLGAANRLMSRFALEIFISFPFEKMDYFLPHKMISVGNPIRSEILGGEEEEARKIFNLTGGKPVILILGGSQGSQRINDLILEILPEILINFELIHQCGEKNFQQVEAEAKVMIDESLGKYYHLFPFLGENELKNAYKIADLIVSRAGSGSIFEIAALAKPSILIPLPEAAQDHQIKNAYTYADRGACIVIEEANLTPHFFLERLKSLFSQPERLREMAENAQFFSRPQAARIIAEYIIGYLSQ